VAVFDLVVSAILSLFSVQPVASSMNTIEFQLREFNTGSFPRGLSFMLGAMSKWLYDRSPTGGLKFEEPLAQLKAQIEESGSKVFQDMINEYLLNNNHRVTVEMVPSKTLEAEQLKEEEDRLAAIKESLAEDELDDIIKKTVALKELQAAEDPPEARATIPSLELEDLKREVTEYPIDITQNENDSGIKVVRHELVSTSGIAYVNFGVDISSLPLEDAALMPLFTRMLMETGAGDMDSVALSRRIGTYTGGVSATFFSSGVKPEGAEEGVVSEGNHMITQLMIQGKATSDKAGELFSLFNVILTDAKLDSKSKVIEMLKESKSRIESSIQASGHQYANTRIKSRYTIGGYIGEKMSGITYLQTVKDLLQQAEEDWPSLLARFERIRNTILDEAKCRSGMILDVTGDSKVLETIQPDIDSFLNELPGDPKGEKLQEFYTEEHPWAVQAKKEMAEQAATIDEGFVVPTQVSYVGKGGQLFQPGEAVSGASAVVARYLRTGYLWDQVRVIGGAYGGFCTFSSNDGFFSFLSYRDPNLADTIDVYDKAGDALIAAADELEKDPDALATAIIGAIGDMDGALMPDQKGFTAFRRWLANESPEARQKFRDEILSTKAEDFRVFGERLKTFKNPTVAVVSSSAAFEAAAKAGKEMKISQVV